MIVSRNRIKTLVWESVKRLLFRLDAEKAHRLVIRLIRWGYRFGKWPNRIVSGGSFFDQLEISRNQISIFGMDFQSRIGLAAGFDKDGEIFYALPDFGFGFVEIGTVTPLEQFGNVRPRLFRKSDEGMLFNRMGFNNLGSHRVSKNLKKNRLLLPPRFRVGVNIGKNKKTPLEDSTADYLAVTQAFRGLSDFIVINVSSPNTDGLRSLQTVEHLSPIVERVSREISLWTKEEGRPPLLLKLSPELQVEELIPILNFGESCGISGWVLTNTLAGEFTSSQGVLNGGYSGSSLTELSRRRLGEVRGLTKLPIISVGGIMDENEAQLRISMGADLIEVYSGWIFNGPGFPRVIARQIDTIKD